MKDRHTFVQFEEGTIKMLDEVDAWPKPHALRGRAMSARFAHQNPGAVAGLALWASYQASSDDLSGSDLAVASIRSDKRIFR